MKQANSYHSLTSYGRAVRAPGVYGSMAAGFPAPRAALLPADGMIVASTPQLLSHNINRMVPPLPARA